MLCMPPGRDAAPAEKERKKKKEKAAASFAKRAESIVNGDLDSGTKHVLCHSSYSQMTSHSVPM